MWSISYNQSFGLLDKKTADRTDMDKNVGAALASCRLIREVFKDYGNIVEEDSKDIRAYLERMIFLYEQILKGEPYTAPTDN